MSTAWKDMGFPNEEAYVEYARAAAAHRAKNPPEDRGDSGEGILDALDFLNAHNDQVTKSTLIRVIKDEDGEHVEYLSDTGEWLPSPDDGWFTEAEEISESEALNVAKAQDGARRQAG